MNLPVDPTKSNPNPDQLLRTLSSQTAFHRTLIGAGIETDPLTDESIDILIEQLSPVELQNAADQIRFAAPPKCYYFTVSSLPHILGEDFEELVSSSAYGAKIHAVIELHDRLYITCSVPESGAQAQLSVAEDSRVTTVVTFSPRTKLLTVRSPTQEIAKSSLQSILEHPTLDGDYRPLFENDRFLRLFDESIVDRFTRLTLRPSESTSSIERIELIAKNQSAAESREDLREDDITGNLLERKDIARQSAMAKLNLGLSLDYEKTNLHQPTVEVDFDDGSIAFQQFVPEDVFIRLDRAIMDCL